MRIIAKRTLREFWERHPDSKEQLQAWYKTVSDERWDSPARVRDIYPRASIIGNNRVVFRIRGNRYRLVAEVFYPGQLVYIRFVGTHEQYNKINAKEV